MANNLPKLYRTERNAHYHLPIFCSFCGHEVISTSSEDEPKIDPCKHTLFIAHDEGYEYLSDRVVEQLRAKGFEVTVDDKMIEVEPPSDDDAHSSPDRVTDDLEFADVMKIAAYVGPPSGFGTYVGFAPQDGG
jgi:hypothetical protein